MLTRRQLKCRATEAHTVTEANFVIRQSQAARWTGKKLVMGALSEMVEPDEALGACLLYTSPSPRD